MTKLLRRCQPWLGTLVEISAYGDVDPRALDQAFAEITRVHRCMSLFEPQSELSRLNAQAFAQDFALSPLLSAVLDLALQVAHASDGAFDPTAQQKASGDFCYVQKSGHLVRFARPLRVDLNGIAKGYAVDLAVAALQQSGVSQAVVNAGGDLRVLGPQPVCVQLRDPSSGALREAHVSIANQALASSGGKLHWRSLAGRRRPTIVSARGRFHGKTGVTVIAPNAALADALTKVALLKPVICAKVLRQFDATAHYLEAN
jgi:FAD:protein FMN transferase